MRSAAVRLLFTIASFVPLVIVLGLATWMATAFSSPTSWRRDDLELAAIVLLGGATVAAFIQIALGIVVALHTTKRPDLTSNQRMGWTLACLFVGSFALPIFCFVVLPGAKPR